jgi:hypothetical protein
MTNPVIVVDTLATFNRGDENDNAMVGATFRHLRYLTNLGATVIVIHHTGKNPTSKYRRASAMEGAVDVGLKVVGTPDDEGLLTRIEAVLQDPYRKRKTRCVQNRERYPATCHDNIQRQADGSLAAKSGPHQR